MSKPGELKIDVGKTFANLPNAPIVEAVIHWQAAPGRELDRTTLEKELARQFPKYSSQLQHDLREALAGLPDAMEMKIEMRWGGFRLASEDMRHICQFKPNAVVFSRLAPYEGWTPFVGEANLFWNAFVDLAAPVSVERIGVRFISKIPLKGGEHVSDLVDEPPAPLESIGLSPYSFFRKDTLDVPNYPYQVNLVRAIEIPPSPNGGARSLIVDIDVATKETTKVDTNAINDRLADMRFLKNKVFFNYLKDAEERFGVVENEQ